jgi:hypothetical protein
MKTLAHCLLLLGLIAAVGGCAEVSNLFSPSSPESEPVAAAPPSDVYFDLFSDIPIPRDMSVDRKRTLVSTAQNGLNIGLLTVTGRVDVRSLNEAMIRDMSRQGWSLRAATTGEKTMQIYEKGFQYAVIYTYEEMFGTVMEIWGAHRLGEGAAGGMYPLGSLSSNPGATPLAK